VNDAAMDRFVGRSVLRSTMSIFSEE